MKYFLIFIFNQATMAEDQEFIEHQILTSLNPLRGRTSPFSQCLTLSFPSLHSVSLKRKRFMLARFSRDKGRITLHFLIKILAQLPETNCEGH